MNLRAIILTFGCGTAGGALFFLLRLPLPWILGPALAVMLLNTFRPKAANWPRICSDFGIMTIAYMLGRTMTPQTARDMWFDLPWMITAAVLWIVICFVIGIAFARMARMEASTCVLGCMPGGLSQMVLMAEDMHKADAGTVAIMQTIRLVVVLYTVPFLATVLSGTEPAASAAFVTVEQTASAWPPLLGFLLLPFVVLSAWAMRRIRMPAGEFAGPALFVGALSAFGCTWPIVPDPLVAAAQLAVGIFIGNRVHPQLIWTNKRLAPLAFGSGILLVTLAALVSWALTKLTTKGIVTWFLSIAPGGLAEMAATSIELGGDVAHVTSYQMARLFTILLLAPPVLRWLIAWHERQRFKRSRGQGHSHPG